MREGSSIVVVPGEVERALNVGAIMTVSVNHNQNYSIILIYNV